MTSSMRRYLVILFLLAAAVLSYLYLPNLTLAGTGSGSKTIDESMARGVFGRIYESEPTRICVDDSIAFDVSAVWTERQWVRGRITGTTRVRPDEKSHYLIVTTVFSDRKSHSESTPSRGILLVVDGHHFYDPDGSGRYSCVWPGRVPDTLRLAVGRTTIRNTHGIERVDMDTLALIRLVGK